MTESPGLPSGMNDGKLWKRILFEPAVSQISAGDQLQVMIARRYAIIELPGDFQQ